MSEGETRRKNNGQPRRKDEHKRQCLNRGNQGKRSLERHDGQRHEAGHLCILILDDQTGLFLFSIPDRAIEHWTVTWEF